MSGIFDAIFVARKAWSRKASSIGTPDQLVEGDALRSVLLREGERVAAPGRGLVNDDHFFEDT